MAPRSLIPADTDIIDLDDYPSPELPAAQNNIRDVPVIDLENYEFTSVPIKEEPVDSDTEDEPEPLAAPMEAREDDAADQAEHGTNGDGDIDMNSTEGAQEGQSISGANTPTAGDSTATSNGLQLPMRVLNLGTSIFSLKKKNTSALAAQLFPDPPQPTLRPQDYDEEPQHEDSDDAQSEADFEKRYQQAKAELKRKQRAGKAGIQDEMEMMRLDNERDARRRKAARDREYDEANDNDDDDDDDDDDDNEQMFVQEAQNTEEHYPLYISSDDEEDDGSDGGAGGRHRKRRPANDDDEDEMDNDVANTGSSKRHRVHALAEGIVETTKPGQKKKRGRPKKAVQKPKAKRAKEPKGKRKGKKHNAPVMTNINNMMGTDVFRDAAVNANFADQPEMQFSTRRPDALKSLIASVPIENRKIANTDKKYLDDAIKDFAGTHSVKPATDGNWSVKGMKATLKHYQILGVSFMRRRENAVQQPRGGILADEMGLGKTIMMLTNIVNGRPPPTAKVKTTLIVAAPALIEQWSQEIGTHCVVEPPSGKAGIDSYMTWNSKIKSGNPEKLLMSQDIVLTTWYELNKKKDEWWAKHYEENKGILHRVPWFRVVLDEAHQIKNHRSRASLSSRALNGKHFWAITGTPILNSVKEMYPYFKLIREPHAGDYKIFKENFCSKDDPRAMEKLHVFLQKFMIRRTHLDKLFNARLLDLPKPQQLTIYLEFNDVERNIYEIVRKRFIARINGLVRSGNIEQKKTHIWVMLLRLRQLCSHALMIQDTIIDLLEREDFERLNKLTEQEGELSDDGIALIGQLRLILAQKHGIEEETGIGTIVEAGVDHDAQIDLRDYENLAGQKHGQSLRFRKYLKTLKNTDKWEQLVMRSLCCGCRQQPYNPHVTSCFHIYCFDCLRDLQHQAARKGLDGARCSECGEQYTSSKPCVGIESFEARETTVSEGTSDSEVHLLRRSGKKKEKNRKKRESDVSDWIDEWGEVMPSAKTMAVKAQVLNWLEEDPTTKIIIYTQFLPMVRILAKVCKTEQWGYCKYTGAMEHDARSKSIKEFADSPDKSILLASLKCGGLGLNLTMASRVICIDPWWNQAIEQQAFCRVFRIGQKKETSMTRLIVRNTVDQTMMDVKARKQIEIDEVMSDTNRPEKLSVNDLMRLFGRVGQDADGKPFIFAEDDTDGQERPSDDSDDEGRFYHRDR
ncbi:hypothetical protein H2203_003265 [Taxawa tesnikishii (nom. ined.)]|nr:hypothetical protein H2203_003265 [Dothideales sp. JES 119]